MSLLVQTRSIRAMSKTAVMTGTRRIKFIHATLEVAVSIMVRVSSREKNTVFFFIWFNKILHSSVETDIAVRRTDESSSANEADSRNTENTEIPHQISIVDLLDSSNDSVSSDSTESSDSSDSPKVPPVPRKPLYYIARLVYMYTEQCSVNTS